MCFHDNHSILPLFSQHVKRMDQLYFICSIPTFFHAGKMYLASCVGFEYRFGVFLYQNISNHVIFIWIPKISQKLSNILNSPWIEPLDVALEIYTSMKYSVDVHSLDMTELLPYIQIYVMSWVL